MLGNANILCLDGVIGEIETFLINKLRKEVDKSSQWKQSHQHRILLNTHSTVDYYNRLLELQPYQGIVVKL